MVQIVNLELGHLTLYCPVTGQKISCESEGFQPSAATKGYWLNEVIEEAEVSDPWLQQVWDSYTARMDAADDPLDVAEFLAAVEKPAWIAFQIKFADMLGDIAWTVIDMNHYDLPAEGT